MIPADFGARPFASERQGRSACSIATARFHIRLLCSQSAMKIPERASQTWSLLAFAARNRQTLTYELVGKLTGMHTAGVGSVLEPIQSYCLLHKLPPLSALVVSKATGLPGTGFIAAQDVPREFVRIFGHDWLTVGCPTPEAFAEAVRQLPSNGLPGAAGTPRTTGPSQA